LRRGGTPVITLLTDYGLRDPFVGICHGVIASICPAARIIDLTHGIARHDLSAGAFVLARSLRFLPVGVHVAVVDPGVGGERRAVAVVLQDGRFLVGPDNGLLWPAVLVGGGVVEAVEISRSPARLEPLSDTFHGRDLFAPVAAHLADGTPLADLGEPVPANSLTVLERSPAQLQNGELVTSVAYIDGFGNVALSASADELAEALGASGAELRVRLADGEIVGAHRGRTFGSVAAGEVVIYEDSLGTLAIAVREGDAAARLRLRGGDRVAVSLAPEPARRPGLGNPRLHLRRTDSTSSRARELAVKGAPHGTLVTAAAQTAGRGRQGRAWFAPPGRALLFSLVLRKAPRLLSLAAGVAVARVVRELVADDRSVQIKWPNDVLLDRRKVAGVLVEGRPQERWSILGVGLNVALDTADLPEGVGAGAATLGLGVEAIEPTLTRLLDLLGEWLAAPDDEVLAAVRELDALLGLKVSWSGVSGIGAGIDDDGSLLVETPGRRRAVDAGEVHLLD
jgi:biotin-[acetyl-CoA-carboxylase] ligase BirA-like protein